MGTADGTGTGVRRLTTAQPGQSPPAVTLNSPAVQLGSAVGTVLTAALAPSLLPYRTAALAPPLCRDTANVAAPVPPQGRSAASRSGDSVTVSGPRRWALSP